jgi:hypothetical protein
MNDAAPLPTTPCGTWHDIVPSCPAVPHWLFMESKAAATRFFWPHAGTCHALLVLGVLNQHQEGA